MSDDPQTPDGKSRPQATVLPFKNGPNAVISEETLCRFVDSFEKSAKRWEIVVYPSLFAFIVLAAYGFYLIYSLTSDIHRMAESIDPHMGTHMKQMTDNIDKLTVNVNRMSGYMETMPQMLARMQGMESGIHAMTASNAYMSQNMATMTHQVARPMSMFNSFIPW